MTQSQFQNEEWRLAIEDWGKERLKTQQGKSCCSWLPFVTCGSIAYGLVGLGSSTPMAILTTVHPGSLLSQLSSVPASFLGRHSISIPGISNILASTLRLQTSLLFSLILLNVFTAIWLSVFLLTDIGLTCILKKLQVALLWSFTFQSMQFILLNS